MKRRKMIGAEAHMDTCPRERRGRPRNGASLSLWRREPMFASSSSRCERWANDPNFPNWQRADPFVGTQDGTMTCDSEAAFEKRSRPLACRFYDGKRRSISSCRNKGAFRYLHGTHEQEPRPRGVTIGDGSRPMGERNTGHEHTTKSYPEKKHS